MSTIDLTARSARELAIASVDYADQMIAFARGYTAEVTETLVQGAEPAWTVLGDAIDSLRGAVRKLEAVEHLRGTFEEEA